MLRGRCLTRVLLPRTFSSAPRCSNRTEFNSSVPCPPVVFSRVDSASHVALTTANIRRRHPHSGESLLGTTASDSESCRAVFGAPKKGSPSSARRYSFRCQALNSSSLGDDDTSSSSSQSYDWDAVVVFAGGIKADATLPAWVEVPLRMRANCYCKRQHSAW